MVEASKKGRGWLWFLGGVLDLTLACVGYVVVVVWLLLGERLAEPVKGWWLSVWAIGGVGVLLLVLGFGSMVWLALLRLGKIERHTAAVVETLRRVLTSQTTSEALLTQVSENLLLSDAIKSVAFREKDRQVIEEAVRQDMRLEQWGSAALLIDELEERFGCKQRAAELRAEMKQLQSATRQEKIQAGIEHVESLWRIHRYDDALHEAGALMRLYPEDKRVQELRRETEQRREAHKKELLGRLEAAVQANDVDQGVEVLKLLDGFLTPTEAAALRESARGVFRAKLQQMGVQFSLFVTEKKWTQALKVGRQIVAEFPNSRMAEEVRAKMDVLERRAARG